MGVNTSGRVVCPCENQLKRPVQTLDAGKNSSGPGQNEGWRM